MIFYFLKKVHEGKGEKRKIENGKRGPLPGIREKKILQRKLQQ